MYKVFFLIVFVLFSWLRSFSQCGNTVYTITQGGSTSFPDGPRYLNLYIHIVRYDDCSGGLNDSQIGQVIDGINASFNPANIYMNVACISDFCSSLCYEDNCQLESFYPTESVPNALNIYLLAEAGQTGLGNGCPDGGQTQSPLPSKNCWAVWNFPGAPAHELGHCLGLDHTFGGKECVTRDPNNPNYNCDREGDGFCDTEADNKNYDAVDLSTCTWDISLAAQLGIKDACEGRVYQTDPSLIMSYSGCGYRFSPQQSVRMRTNAFSGSAGPQADPIQYSGHYISVPTTWTTPKRFNVDVIVASSLTINGTTVEMAPGKRIILLNGSALTVDNSTITVGPIANCGNNGNGVMWKGIEIHSADPYDTFIDIVNGSIIERAYYGLYLATALDNTSWINIRNSYFNDNYVAMYLISKDMAHPSLKIRETTIQITPNYPLTTYNRQVYLGNFPMFAVSNLRFKNTKDIYATKAGGLYAYNGWVTIGSGSQEGFEKGLEGINFGLLNQMTVKSFVSTKSANHISISARRGNNLTGLVITQGDRNNLSGSANNFGVKLTNCQSNTIRNNSFTNQTTISGDRTGLDISRVGTEKQIVGTVNNFNHYKLAISSGSLNSNVEYLCNYHSVNTRDFLITDAKPDQGTLLKPAGNTFTVASASANNVNILSNILLNYYYGNGSNEFPNSVDQHVTRIPVQVQGCLYSFNNTPSTDISVLDGQYLDISYQLSQLTANNDSVILDQIHDLEIQLEEVYNQAFSLITSPEQGEANHNLLITWLQRVNTFESYLQVAYIHLMDRNYSQANATLSAIPNLFSLTTDQQSELTNATWVFNFMIPVFQSGRWEGELTNSEVLNLRSFVNNNESNAAIMVQNILAFFYDEQSGGNQLRQFNDVPYITGVNSVQKNTESIEIFPNPVDENISIKINDKLNIATYQIKLKNITGQILMNRVVSEYFSSFDLSKLPSGVYFIEVFKNLERINIRKIIKS